MIKRKAVTEESGIQKMWYEKAKKIRTIRELGSFVRELRDKYKHDYGTICHAIAAAAIAAAWCTERGPSGGITGFQAGAVMWEFIEAWGASEVGPKRLYCYRDLLYPQLDYKLSAVDKPTRDWLTKEAKKLLKEQAKDPTPCSLKVLARWKMIASGVFPPCVVLEER